MKSLWIVTAVFVLAVTGLVGVWRFGAIPFVPDVPGAAMKVIASLLVVTLIIERSLAAINAAVFTRPKHMKLAALRDVEVGLDLGAIQPSDARKEAKPLRDSLAEIAGKEEQLRVAIGFALAILVSSAGIRTLAALVMIDGAGGLPDGTQKDLAHVVDILVTAGLITGGSDGLAQLLQMIKDGLKPPPKPL